jgi:hypothetical protein
MPDVKRAAKHLQLPYSNQSKDVLIDAINKKLANKSLLEDVIRKADGNVFLVVKNIITKFPYI